MHSLRYILDTSVDMLRSYIAGGEEEEIEREIIFPRGKSTTKMAKIKTPDKSQQNGSADKGAFHQA